MMTNELSTGKTIFILAVVVGCFAILWPKVFYPMLTASVKTSTQPAPQWRDPLNAHHLTQLCFLLEEQRDPILGFNRWTEEECFAQLKSSCRVVLTERILEGFRLEKDKTNLTECLRQRFYLTPQKVSSAAPPPTRTRPYQPHTVIHPHVRPERPSSLHSDSLHPALREKGRTMPQRTIEKEARPGPMPGLRPPMGGGGHMVPPQSKGSGAMGIIMPLYTVGIVIFFIYTIMKVLFKKNCEEDKTPKLKDFHMDPEYRKYVFAEEYLDSANASHRDLLRRQEREASRQRRRQEVTPPDTKIEDEQMDQLRRRLEETERAMERLMSQMGSVTDKLTAAKITEVLSQAQAQAKMLKELGEGASDDDFTTSEALTNTYSEDYSLPIILQRHLLELQVKDHYQKGTSVGTFVPPPTPLQEVASLAEEEIPIEVAKADEFSPIPSTNGTNLLVTNLSIDVKLKEIEQEMETVISKSENDMKRDMIMDQLSSYRKKHESVMPAIGKDLNRLILESKLKGEFSGFSDIAQRDDNASAGSRSSNPSETGADISELKSFADECIYPSTNGECMPKVQEQVVPEVTYHVPEFTMPKNIDMDKPAVICKINDLEEDTKPTNLAFESQQQPVSVPVLNVPKGIEHGTQTDVEKKLSVLNFGTTYQINKQEQERGMDIHEVEDRVNEIILDATLPIDTQLLVREAHVGSRPVENIEIDVSEIENNPCVVTSQVSLAFVGLEQNEPQGIMTIILPEKRSLTMHNEDITKKDVRNENVTRPDEHTIEDTKLSHLSSEVAPILISSEALTPQQPKYEKCLKEVDNTIKPTESSLEAGSLFSNKFTEKDNICSKYSKDITENIKIIQIEPKIEKEENQRNEKLQIFEEFSEKYPLTSQDQKENTTSCTNEPQEQKESNVKNFDPQNAKALPIYHEFPIQNQLQPRHILHEDEFVKHELEMKDTLQTKNKPLSNHSDTSCVNISDVKDHQIPQNDRGNKNVSETTSDQDNVTILHQIQTVEENLGQAIEEDFEKLKEIIADVTASTEMYYLEKLSGQKGCQNTEVELNDLMNLDKRFVDELYSSACPIQGTEMEAKVTDENLLNKLEEAEHVVHHHDLETAEIIQNALLNPRMKKNIDIELRNKSETVPTLTFIDSAIPVNIIDYQKDLSIGEVCTPLAETQETHENIVCRAPSTTRGDSKEKNVPLEVSVEKIPLVVENRIEPHINGISSLENLTYSHELHLIAEILVQRTTSDALEIISKMDPKEIKILREEASHIVGESNMHSASKVMELDNLVLELYSESNKEPMMQPGNLGERKRVEKITGPNSATNESNTPRKDSQTSSHERMFAVVSAEHANGLPKVEPSNETMEILKVEPLATSRHELYSSMKRHDESAFSAEEAVLLANKGVKSLLNQSSSSPAQAADDDETVETKG